MKISDLTRTDCRGQYLLPTIKIIKIVCSSERDIICTSFTTPDVSEEDDPFNWE